MSDTPRTDGVEDQIKYDGVPAKTAVGLALNISREFEKKIIDHNAECEKLCDNGKGCGYAKYSPRLCPECPLNWTID